MKILNIKYIHERKFGKQQRPTPATMQDAYKAACAAGITIGRDGRAYAPWTRAAPRLPNGRNGRWEKGQVVPRKRA